jgi:ABC-type dipeptide/oligopeptide/nickel transport system ATPase component
MPKVSRTQKFRSKAASTSAVLRTPLLNPPSSETKDESTNNNNIDKNNEMDNDAALSRGQRKRQAKRDQYLKREKMILSTLKLHKMEEQKKRIDGLDAIKEALVQTIKENQNKQRHESDSPSSQQTENVNLKSNKSKKDIAEKEITHLNLVLQHPSFKSNPFATIQEHLRNTLAQQAKEQEVAAQKALVEEEKKNEQKKEAKKERILNAKYEKARRQRRRR